MSDIKNQDSDTAFQSFEQKALNASDFAAFRAECQAFFQADAAQFEQKVPGECIIQVKKIFKLIKEFDPQAFKILKPMRTAIGLIDRSDLDIMHKGLKNVRTALKEGKITASAAHALIYVMVLEHFRYAHIVSIPELPNNPGKISRSYFDQLKQNSSYFDQLEQNPQAVYWLRCFVSAYLTLLADCDTAHWSLIAKGDEHPKTGLTRDWALAYLQLKALDELVKVKA